MRIVQVFDLDADSVELTCNSLMTKKVHMTKLLDEVMGGNLMSMRNDMVEALPKVFKVVVDWKFYEKNNLNVRKTVDLDVTI